MRDVRQDSDETVRLLELVHQGDRQALEHLLIRYRPELREFVETRMSQKVASRLDPSDVVQETQLSVAQRMDDFLKRKPMPFRLWVRKTAYERLIDLERHHLKRARRSVQREVPFPDRSSILLARHLVRHGSSPSQRMQAKELAQHAAHALSQLPDLDRQILVMRHGEEMSFDEIGCVLELESATIRKRFGRALLRLQKILSDQGLLG